MVEGVVADLHPRRATELAQLVGGQRPVHVADRLQRAGAELREQVGVDLGGAHAPQLLGLGGDSRPPSPPAPLAVDDVPPVGLLLEHVVRGREDGRVHALLGQQVEQPQVARKSVVEGQVCVPAARLEPALDLAGADEPVALVAKVGEQALQAFACRPLVRVHRGSVDLGLAREQRMEHEDQQASSGRREPGDELVGALEGPASHQRDRHPQATGI